MCLAIRGLCLKNTFEKAIIGLRQGYFTCLQLISILQLNVELVTRQQDFRLVHFESIWRRQNKSKY